MHPLLDETHELVRKSAAEFAEREIDPFVKNMENYEYPRDLLRDMGKLGLLAPMGQSITAGQVSTSGLRY